MHCPRCGQQQIAEDTRFCSRCGLLLDLVAEVVSNNGTLPHLENLGKKRSWFNRTLGFKLSALWFVVWVLFLLPFAGATGAPDEVMGGFAIIGFFGTLLLVMISWMFLPKAVRLNQATAAYQADYRPSLAAGTVHGALPPQQTMPASSYVPPSPGSWRETNDLQPVSVTDGTTRILQEKESN